MMKHGATSPLGSQLAAALDWWRDAGVDCDFIDQPRNWLPVAVAAEAAPPSPASKPSERSSEPQTTEPAQIAIGGDRSVWPKDLVTFQTWWMNEPSLDPSEGSARVPPRGNPDAEIMVLIAQPEAQDTDQLLSGPNGKLLDAMLAALGIEATQTYLAAALVRHTPMADWADLAARGLGPILRHHIALVAPKRLIVLGNNVLPLLGNDLTHSPAFLPGLNQDGGNLPVLGAVDLGALLARPRSQARFWERWLDWTNQGAT